MQSLFWNRKKWKFRVSVGQLHRIRVCSGRVKTNTYAWVTDYHWFSYDYTWLVHLCPTIKVYYLYTRPTIQPISKLNSPKSWLLVRVPIPYTQCTSTMAYAQFINTEVHVLSLPMYSMHKIVLACRPQCYSFKPLCYTSVTFGITRSRRKRKC